MNEAAKNLTRSHYLQVATTNFVNGKLSDVYEDSNDDMPKQDILIIKVEYGDDVFEINIPVSLTTLAVVKKEINKRCKLNPETYKLKYLDEDEEWISMTSDEHIGKCIRCRGTVHGINIRLRVLPLT
nr:hypothetical protein [Tanacetum cinerariifolium]